MFAKRSVTEWHAVQLCGIIYVGFPYDGTIKVEHGSRSAMRITIAIVRNKTMYTNNNAKNPILGKVGAVPFAHPQYNG